MIHHTQKLQLLLPPGVTLPLLLPSCTATDEANLTALSAVQRANDEHLARTPLQRDDAPSPLAVVLPVRSAGFRESMRSLDDHEVERLVEASHLIAQGHFTGFGESAALPAEGADVRLLEPFERRALGAMSVAWDAHRNAPSHLGNLAFARRGLGPLEVWRAFRAEHLAAMQRLWGIEDANDLRLEEIQPLGDSFILRGPRYRAGLPVDGQFFEVTITGSEHILGAGVLTDIRARWYRTSGVLAGEPAAWIAEAQARVNTRLASNARGHLSLSCSPDCHPYWTFANDALVVMVDAVDGRVVSSEDAAQHIGPLLMPGWPPGTQAQGSQMAPQPIRYRSANIIDANGNSVGNTDANGHHSLTQNASLRIGLEGPVGANNPASIGRIRRSRIVNGADVNVPSYVNWNPALQPQQNFSSPSAWPPSF